MGYRAFFSYARADDKIANWLHHQLDAYRTPKALIGADGAFGQVPAKLHPIFRDRTDLQAGGRVDASLQAALEDSETLVVLCTPTSAKSHWVNHECETFLKLGRADRIFPVIAAGEPGSGDPETECFPPALRGRGLLAADLREINLPTGQLIGDGKDGGRLKLIAGLLGVPLDALAQRETRRQRQLIAALSAATLVFLGVATAAVGAGVLAARNSQEAQRQRVAAEENAARERRAREDERRERDRADAETLRAIANAREAERQEGYASESARQARSTLHRFFATQAWDRRERDGYLIAARYALAGMQLAPENAELYRSALASIMHDAEGSAAPMIHGDVVTCAQFAPDGTVAVSAGADGIARVVDVRTGRLVATLRGHQGAINSLGFSPDGARLVTTSDDGSARVWSTSNWRALAILTRHPGRVLDAAFSSDGRRLVTVGDSPGATVWDAQSGEPLFVLSGHTAEISRARFSFDGTRILTASEDRSARVWDARTGQPLAALYGHQSGLVAAAFSADGLLVITASRDNTAKIWDSGGTLRATLDGHQGSLRDAAFSPDGRLAVTAGDDGRAIVWDASDGRLLAHLDGHHGEIWRVVFSPDGSSIATAGEDGVVMLWDVRAFELRKLLVGHRSAIKSVAFSQNGSLIVTASDDNTARVWSTRSDDIRWRVVGSFGDHLVPSPDGIHAAITNGTASAGLLDIATGANAVPLRGHAAIVVGANFSPDGSRLVTASHDGTARIWQVPDGRELAVLSQPGRVWSAQFSRDGAFVVVSDDEGLSIFDSRRFELVARVPTARAIWNAAVIPQGPSIVFQNEERLDVFNVRWGRPDAVFSLADDETILDITSSRDGERVAGVSSLGAIQVLSRRGGGSFSAYRLRSGSVGGIAFSPDGTRIAAASYARGVQIWDVSGGRLLATLATPDEATSVVFTADGERVVSVTSERGIAVWNVVHLTQTWDDLARKACLNLLGPVGRTFDRGEMDADPLLTSEWSIERDVCAGVRGVPSVRMLLAAQLPAE